MAVEEKLSDALHERLTQRFVDRRTSVLMRQLGGKGATEFPVLVDEQGEVTVGSFSIGRMEGFSFEVDPTARHTDRKMLLATAERRLGGESRNERRARPDTNDHFRYDRPVSGGDLGRGPESGAAGPGQNLLSTRFNLDRRIEPSRPGPRGCVARLKTGCAENRARVAPLRRAGARRQDAATPPAVGRSSRSSSMKADRRARRGRQAPSSDGQRRASRPEGPDRALDLLCRTAQPEGCAGAPASRRRREQTSRSCRQPPASPRGARRSADAPASPGRLPSARPQMLRVAGREARPPRQRRRKARRHADDEAW